MSFVDNSIKLCTTKSCGLMAYRLPEFKGSANLSYIKSTFINTNLLFPKRLMHGSPLPCCVPHSDIGGNRK